MDKLTWKNFEISTKDLTHFDNLDGYILLDCQGLVDEADAAYWALDNQDDLDRSCLEPCIQDPGNWQPCIQAAHEDDFVEEVLDILDHEGLLNFDIQDQVVA